MPKSALVAIGVTIVFLGLLALEICDGLILHWGQPGMIANSLYIFPFVLAILCGLFARRRWAWVAARVVAAAFIVVFFALTTWACIKQPIDVHGPVWIWLTTVSFILATVLAIGFIALGRPTARQYYCNAAAPSEGQSRGT